MFNFFPSIKIRRNIIVKTHSRLYLSKYFYCSEGLKPNDVIIKIKIFYSSEHQSGRGRNVRRVRLHLRRRPPALQPEVRHRVSAHLLQRSRAQGQSEQTEKRKRKWKKHLCGKEKSRNRMHVEIGAQFQKFSLNSFWKL